MGANESRSQHKTSGDKKTRIQNGNDVVRTGCHQQQLDVETENAIMDLENAIRGSEVSENPNEAHPIYNNPLTINQPMIDEDTLPTPIKTQHTYAQPIKQHRDTPPVVPGKKTSNNVNKNSPPPKPQRVDNSKQLNTESEQPELNIQLSSQRHPENRMTQSSDSPSHNNMNTIKQAKVNVRDRINIFKTDDTGKQLPIQLKPTSQRPKTHIETSSQFNITPRKPFNDNRVKSGLDNHSISEQTTSKSLLAEIDGENSEFKGEVSPRPPRHEVTGRKLSADNRMNTIDMFNKLKKDHEVLNKFEKARPAAKRNKRKPHNRMTMNPELELEHQSRLPRTQMNGQFGSDPDLVKDTKRSSDDNQESEEPRESLATINNKTGQKYAMDDTAYETLRRKKIAGQRHAIGVMDRTTEKNFLLSLKRNFQFKRHVQLDDDDDNDETTLRDHYISDIVF